MTPWETAVCQRAVDTYGEEPQLIICMEEMAELTKELTKHLRGRDNLPQIAEEVADVEIMLEQVKLLFDLRDAVADAKEAKLLRLRERIIKDTGRQDYPTSLCRKWLVENYGATVGKNVTAMLSTHELKNPE